ncbi:MAG: STAS domain-containing protein [Fibrobacter sp.]|nr:STAS domain-containing protein [Fibrobacter sp.]
MIIKEVPAEERFGDLWVELPDAITMYNSREIEAVIRKKMSSNIKRVVLNLSKTYNLFSSGLRLMLTLRKRIMFRGGDLVLVNVSASIRELLTDMNLDKVFQIFSTEVEFEVLHEDVWNQKSSQIEGKFIFLAQVENKICHITLSGEMVDGQDFSKCRQFKPQPGTDVFVIDFSSLDMIDASGSSILLDLISAINTTGASCRGFGAAEMVRGTLELFDVERLVTFYKDEKSALVAK